MTQVVVGVVSCCVLSATAIAGQQADPCKSRANQLELTQCAEGQFSASDKVLTETYRKLLADLDDEHRGLLQKAQRAWVGFRDADCDLDASVAIGGSMHGMLVADCRTAMTNTRVKDLKTLRTSLAEFLR